MATANTPLVPAKRDGPGGSPPPTWSTRVTFWLVGWFATFSFTVVLPDLNLYLERIHARDSELMYGIITGVFPLATALGGVVLPLITRRYRPRLGIVFAGAFGLSLPMVAYGFANNLWAILVIRFLAGLTTSVTLFCRQGLTGGGPKVTSHNMAGFTVAMGLGYAVGPVAGSALKAADEHHKYGLVGVVSMAVALCLGIWTSVKLWNERSKGRVSLPKPAGTIQAAKAPSAVSPQLLLLYTVNCAVSILFVAFVAAAVPRIQTVFHWSNAKAGYIQGVIGLAYALCGGSNGVFLNHLSYHMNFLISLGGCFVSSALLANWGTHAPSEARVVIGCILAGFGYSLTNTMVMKRVGIITKRDPLLQTTAFARLTTFMSFARIVASVWTGLMLHFDVGPDLYYGNMGLAVVATAAAMFIHNAPQPL